MLEHTVQDCPAWAQCSVENTVECPPGDLRSGATGTNLITVTTEKIPMEKSNNSDAQPENVILRQGNEK